MGGRKLCIQSPAAARRCFEIICAGELTTGCLPAAASVLLLCSNYCHSGDICLHFPLPPPLLLLRQRPKPSSQVTAAASAHNPKSRIRTCRINDAEERLLQKEKCELRWHELLFVNKFLADHIVWRRILFVKRSTSQLPILKIGMTINGLLHHERTLLWRWKIYQNSNYILWMGTGKLK